MSKRVNNLLNGLHQRLLSTQKIIEDMEGDVEIFNKETEPEAYRRWYLSYHAVKNLEGLVGESLDLLDTYYTYKKLPWWKKIVKRRH